MFEKYDTKDLYIGEVEEIEPFSITKVGGLLDITGNFYGIKKRILLKKEDNYYDIFNLERTINIMDEDDRSFMPKLSKDRSIYILYKNSIVPYLKYKSEANPPKEIQVWPFEKVRRIK